MNITTYLTDCIINKIPVSFSKYGDGEYYCASGSISMTHNCDLDIFTNKLQSEIINSIKFMVNERENSFIGLWKNDVNKSYWESLVINSIRWADYQTIIIHHDDVKNNDDNLRNKLNLYKTIKYSTLKKIIICNPLLIRSEKLLNIDHMVHIPLRNWFDNHLDDVLNKTSSYITLDEPFILITCCGMGAKVIISEMSKKFPNGIYLDFGSAIDLICTKRNSRGWDYTYEEMKPFFNELLPDDWEDEKYNEIFELAKVNMGLHLPK